MCELEPLPKSTLYLGASGQSTPMQWSSAIALFLFVESASPAVSDYRMLRCQARFTSVDRISVANCSPREILLFVCHA